MTAGPIESDELKHARIGIVYPRAIGDFVFALPALHTLRKLFPEAFLLLVAKEKQAPLARCLPGPVVDEVAVLSRGAGYRQIRRKLAGCDLCLDLAGNDQAGMLLSFLPSARRLRPHASDCKGMCAIYTPFAERLPKLPPSLHRVDRMLAHVSCLQRGEADYSFHLHLPSEAVDACESSIEKYSLRDGTTVVLNLGASRAAKRWPPERFRLLAEELIGKGFRAIVTGAASFPYDRNYDSRVAADFFGPSFADGSDCVNLVNEQNLAPDLHLQRDTHLLRYSGVPRVVVGSDTGPMQIAGSVGTDAAVRTISLFGPTNWQRYAPYDPSREYPHKPNGDHNSVITAGRPDCVPQDNREACNRYRRGCRSAECMENITVDMVMERVLAAAR